MLLKRVVCSSDIKAGSRGIDWEESGEVWERGEPTRCDYLWQQIAIWKWISLRIVNPVRACGWISLRLLQKKLLSGCFKRIAAICINEIPTSLVGPNGHHCISLMRNSDICIWKKKQSPFIINKSCSLNRSPSPMVARRSQQGTADCGRFPAGTRVPIFRMYSAVSFSKNYESSSCIIAPLICLGRVVGGVLNDER
jgi:hypothetical protein